MSKTKSKEEIKITSEEVQDDININETPAEEWQQEPKYKVLGNLWDYTFNHGTEIAPDVDAIAQVLDMSVDEVKECIGELHKENQISDGTDGTIKVNALEIRRKGFPICAVCGSELVFKDESVTKDNYYRVRYTCPTCKNGKAEFKTKAKVE